MIIFLSIASGIFIILISLFLIRKEFQRASENAGRYRNTNFTSLSDSNVHEVLSYLDRIELTIDEMNQSFYDIANDLEEKYSMHNKEIEIIDQKVNDINLLTSELAKLLKFQGKELASMKSKEEKKKSKQKKGLVEIKEEIMNKEEEVQAIHDVTNQAAEELIEYSNDYYHRTNETDIKNNLKDEILKLKALGMDVNQIAKQLNKGVREIEIFMNLSK